MVKNGVKIKGFIVSQNGQDFIIGKAKIKEILSYTKYTERVIIGFDENEKPIYNQHVQRKVDKARVEKIADFLINDAQATFPTNVVLGVPMSIIESQSHTTDGIIEVVFSDIVYEQVSLAKKGQDNTDIYVTIIDGQHRIRGIEVAVERLEKEINKIGGDASAQQRLDDLLNIELAVSYFIDKSLEYQAMIFSTINRTQKKVSQDLVYSLFGLSSNDTPYKTALEVVLALNGHPKSPFYKRIKLYGGDYDKHVSPPLSQATMIKSIVALISESLRESENDKYRSRKDLRTQRGNKFLPFRQFYANNNDYMISDCLFYYFNTVRNYLSEYWQYDGLAKPSNVLQSTVGYEALLNLLVDILKHDQIDTFNSDTFVPYIQKILFIDISDTEKFPMSTKGRNILYLTMSLKVFPAIDDNDGRMIKLEKLRL